MHRHVVLLGASNMSRGFGCAVRVARSCFAEELSFYVAKGFGRSYGVEAGAFGKKFPGIFSCEIWRAIEEAKSAPTSALITDIGNDLGYEVPVETILRWVEACVERLIRQRAEIVICDLPMDSIRGLSERRYRLFRSILFPRCRLSRNEILQRMESLQSGLHELAKKHFIPVFAVETHWYGFDPIHPRSRFLQPWFRGMFDLFEQQSGASSRNSFHWSTNAYLNLLRPDQWKYFGFDKRSAQPAGRLIDGSKIFLY